MTVLEGALENVVCPSCHGAKYQDCALCKNSRVVPKVVRRRFEEGKVEEAKHLAERIAFYRRKP